MSKTIRLGMISLLACSVCAHAANFPGTSIDDPNSHGRLQLFKRLHDEGKSLLDGVSEKAHELGLTKESSVIHALESSGMKVSFLGDQVTVLIPTALFFTPETTNIREEQKAALNLLYEFVKGSTQGSIQVIGYSENLGRKDRQMQFSEYVARAIAGIFWVNGMSESNMQVHGHGTQKQYSDQADSLYNARVEVHFTRKG